MKNIKKIIKKFSQLLFNEGRTYGQPEVVRISLPQVATGLRSCRRRHSSPEGCIPCRLLCTGHSYAEGVSADTILSYGKCYLPEINAGYGRKGGNLNGDERHGIRIPVLDENGNQKVGARNRKQWKRVLTDATGWNDPKNCELWRSE